MAFGYNLLGGRAPEDGSVVMWLSLGLSSLRAVGQYEFLVLSGHLHITFLGTKLNMSVDPKLKEESLEIQCREMIIACICLALYNLQSSSTCFISFDLQSCWA